MDGYNIMTKYECDFCHFITKNRTDYTRHCITKKHKILENKVKLNTKQTDVLHRYHIDNTQISHPKKTQKNAKKTEIGSCHPKIPKNMLKTPDRPTDQPQTNTNDNTCEQSERTNMAPMACMYCGISYSRHDSLKRHMIKCPLKEQYKHKNDKLLEKIDEQTKLIAVKDEEIHYFRQVLAISTENNNNNNKSISTFNFINNNYKDAEQIEPMTMEKFIENNDIKYARKNDENDENDKPYEEKFIEDVIYSHRNKILHQYLGDTIIRIYKKTNPYEQSIWTTDASRLKYVIRSEPSRWTVDCMGHNTCKMLIDPLLESLDKSLTQYNINYCIEDGKSDYTYEQQEKMMRDNLSILEIRKQIELKKLHTDILKYMAPFFRTDIPSINDKE